METVEAEILPFNWFSTGQMILVFQTPLEMVDRLNVIYDDLKSKDELHSRNNNLIGKIKDEYSLYLDDNSNMPNHNHMPRDILEWVEGRICQYLNFISQTLQFECLGIRLDTIWVNDYKAGEYNPVHRHFGGSNMYKSPLERKNYDTGLIGMMILKVPDDMGSEFTNENDPRNGQLEFLGSGGGQQFAISTLRPKMAPGTFVVFPYDMSHCVYPHFNEKETRRTMPCNFDVYIDLKAKTNAL